MLASSSRHALRKSQITKATSPVCRSLSASMRADTSQQRRYASAQASTRNQSVHSPHEAGNPFASSRSGPFARPPDTTYRAGQLGGSSIAPENLLLGRLADEGNIKGVFKICRRIKDRGIMPDHTTYDYILQACAHGGLHQEALAVFEDMMAMEIEPNRQTFHHLLHALRYTPIKETQAQIDLMHTYSIRPNETTYELLIDRLVHAGHLETAIQTLALMGNEGIAPTLNAAQAVIKLACDLHFPRLALDLAQAFESTSVRRIDPGIWACILVSSSESLYEKGVLTAWKKTVHDFGLTPDEGCCINVLHTVGRYGLAALGLDVILVLRRMNILWHEHHFAPVIEALCVVGNIEEAFGMLELMRDCDIVPVQETAYPIFQAIRTDVDKLDEAWGILETMREQGRKVDVVALNTIIQASVALGDLQRALGTYRAAGDLGITPTVDTFNLLLSACIAVSHRELGDRLLAEMRAASIRPDLRTYERLVVLCLTQPTYEDAFFYLEDMKSAGIKPTQNIYDALIRRCVSAGDTRYNLAVEEMLEQGYDMPEKLQNFIARGGERATPQYPAGEDRPRGRQRRPRSEDETPKEILELIPPLSKN